MFLHPNMPNTIDSIDHHYQQIVSIDHYCQIDCKYWSRGGFFYNAVVGTRLPYLKQEFSLFVCLFVFYSKQLCFRRHLFTCGTFHSHELCRDCTFSKQSERNRMSRQSGIVEEAKLSFGGIIVGTEAMLGTRNM